MRYSIQPGDTVSKIAIKLTGNMDNWPALAAHNNLQSPYTIFAGNTLDIPSSMLPPTSKQPRDITPGLVIRPKPPAPFYTSPLFLIALGVGAYFLYKNKLI